MSGISPPFSHPPADGQSGNVTPPAPMEIRPPAPKVASALPEVQIRKIPLTDPEVQAIESRFPLELRQCWDNLTCGVVVLGAEGKVEFWNKAAEDWGLRRNQVLDLEYGKIVPTVEEEGRLKHIQTSLQTGEVIGLKNVIHRSLRRGARYQDLTLSRFTDSKGENHVMIQIEDTTDRVFMHQMGTYAARVLGHEVRTPLNPAAMLIDLVGGELYSLRSEFKIPPERMTQLFEDVDTVSRGIRDANRIIDTVLDTMKSNKIVLAPQQTDLRPLIAKTVDLMQSKAKLSNIDLTFEASPDMPDVLADQTRIQQVFSGLLNNAIKYTPLRTENNDGTPKEGHRVAVKAGKGGKGVVVTVSDNGPGIPQDQLGKIFEMGARATGDQVEGHGIGLAVHQAIVLAHGGKIEVTSQEGVGSTFTVTLPAMEEKTT